uniref:Ammonium transporter AmtB-like domain-containing protein n=1 Tax=Timema genevievae TaxID=629358 RepID=A0A7R9JVA3_TIMGE|nr:unnamed protein product [Timema genevievae]
MQEPAIPGPSREQELTVPGHSCSWAVKRARAYRQEQDRFLAFNGGSLGTMVGAGDSGLIARVICNTVMGGSGGGLIILAACKLGMFGPPAWSFAFTLNAALIGMVSVTAGVNEMSLWTSFVSGLFGGPVYVALHYLVIKLKVDDPLDAVAVHLGGGIWGLLAASIFANNGLIFGDIYRASMLLANRVLGALAIFTWTVATCSIMFGILKALNLMRVTAEQELQGLDASLHREIGYPRSAWEPNFQIPETKLPPISSNKKSNSYEIHSMASRLEFENEAYVRTENEL